MSSTIVLADVKAATNVATGDDNELTQHIENGSSFCDELFAGDGLTDGQLKRLKIYVSAHFYRIYRPAAETSSRGGTSQQSNTPKEMGFNSTREGQMAIMLDPTGKLAEASMLDKIVEKTAIYTEADYPGKRWDGTTVS